MRKPKDRFGQLNSPSIQNSVVRVSFRKIGLTPLALQNFTKDVSKQIAANWKPRSDVRNQENPFSAKETLVQKIFNNRQIKMIKRKRRRRVETLIVERERDNLEYRWDGNHREWGEILDDDHRLRKISSAFSRVYPSRSPAVAFSRRRERERREKQRRERAKGRKQR